MLTTSLFRMQCFPVSVELLLHMVGILFVQHKDLKCHFEHFFLTHFTYKQNLIWKGVWAVVVWSIWEQRNFIIFRQGVVDEEQNFHMAQLKA